MKNPKGLNHNSQKKPQNISQEISNIYALKLSATSPRQNYESLYIGNVQDASDEFMTVCC